MATSILDMLGRQTEFWAVMYKRTWKGSIVTSFVEPLLYLLALGVGLGAFVDASAQPTDLGGVSYLLFIAPGLLAATAMRLTAGEATWPVYSNFRWSKTYLAMQVTPLRAADILLAHLGYLLFRLVITCAAFLLVLWAFGALVSPLAVFALPVAVLVGMAYATPTFALSAYIESTYVFPLYFRLGIIPMFLFSGAFFPVEQLPALLEPVAYAVPLYHGVEACRMLTLGDVAVWAMIGHLLYLVIWVAAGGWLAWRMFRRRLARSG